MTLYELTGDFIKLIDTKKEIDDAEVQKDIEESIKNKIIKKLEGYAKARQSINAEINALKEEEKRLQERRKKLEKRSSMQTLLRSPQDTLKFQNAMRPCIKQYLIVIIKQSEK